MEVDGARCASAQLVTATGIVSIALLGSFFFSDFFFISPVSVEEAYGALG